jgi:hypothetical protein
MRENESELKPAPSDGDQESAGSWGANGSDPAAGAEAQSPETAATTDDLAAEAPVADAPVADATDDDSSAFLADLARVMQTAAGAERNRIAEDSERRRNAHLELIRARETSETEQLTVLAEGDVKAIDTWADAEIERIQSERERRITSRRSELAQRLEDHRLLIGREVDAVEAAIAAYRTEVEVYFSRLDAESDPVAIAREAGRRPQFPVLGAPGPDDAPPAPAGDSAAATAEADPVASGEPEAAVASPEEPGEPAETKAESAETTLGPNAVAPRSSAALMSSWFRRGDDSRPDPDA